ncbi:uncharacterized protein RHO25_012689 [Cercospora beticola]|nr:hypothetical protein RHO25_012689 [Cercospora beticola]
MDHYKFSTTKLLDNGKFSDFTIVCGATGREYKTHRSILSSQSKWFDRCCSREDFIEGQERRAVLREDDPLALEKMVEYFYRFDYSDDVSGVDQDHQSPPSVVSSGTIVDVIAASITELPIQLHAQVYAIADKYEAPDVKKAAQDKFRAELAKNMDSTKVMGAAIAAVYLETELPESDRGLKDLLATAWVVPGNRRITELHVDCLKYVLTAAPDFLFDVQKLLLRSFPSCTRHPKFRCPSCKKLSVVYYSSVEELWRSTPISCNACHTGVQPRWIEFSQYLKVERWWVTEQGA